MSEKGLCVECYTGHKGEERPSRGLLDGQMTDVAAVEDCWYSPGMTYFRVLLSSDERYVLRRREPQDVWAVEAFRASAFRLQSLDRRVNARVYS